MDFKNFEGQVFGTRKILKNKCTPSDWTNVGLPIPENINNYKLSECLNCGSIFPSFFKTLKRYPPKRCVFCSNIGNRNHVQTKTNNWVVHTDYAICNVIHKNKVVSFFIDSEDYERTSKFIWRISQKRQKYYVLTGSEKKKTAQYLHYFILGKSESNMEIDHIDGNSLNNTKNNLRLVDRQTNIDNQIATRIDNQIGIRGIAYAKRNKDYRVDFNYHNTRYYTKPWKTLEEAVWCRKCFEDYFNLPALRNNPLAQQYYTLTETQKNEIQQYVLSKILGNERY